MNNAEHSTAQWHFTVRLQFKSISQGARPLEVGQPIKGNRDSKAL
ncbi:hypothetical protein ACIPV9_21800 [Pseudomonas psychrophila]